MCGTSAEEVLKVQKLKRSDAGEVSAVGRKRQEEAHGPADIAGGPR